MTALEKQQKKISVIIPVYNAEKYIRETLDSIIKQSYKNLEIILIDNGSKDRSPDIIQKYEAKYPEIHMIEESGKGPGASRNRGLKLAKGDYIVFADADDYLPDKEIFCKYINLAEQTDADIVVSNYQRMRHHVEEPYLFLLHDHLPHRSGDFLHHPDEGWRAYRYACGHCRSGPFCHIPPVGAQARCLPDHKGCVSLREHC